MFAVLFQGVASLFNIRSMNIYRVLKRIVSREIDVTYRGARNEKVRGN